MYPLFYKSNKEENTYPKHNSIKATLISYKLVPKTTKHLAKKQMYMYSCFFKNIKQGFYMSGLFVAVRMHGFSNSLVRMETLPQEASATWEIDPNTSLLSAALSSFTKNVVCVLRATPYYLIIKTIFSISWAHTGIIAGIDVLRGIILPDPTIQNTSTICTFLEIQQTMQQLVLSGILITQCIYAFTIPTPMNIVTALVLIATAFLQTYNDRALANHIQKSRATDPKKIFDHAQIFKNMDNLQTFQKMKIPKTVDIAPLDQNKDNPDNLKNVTYYLPKLNYMFYFTTLQLVSTTALMALYTLAPPQADPLKRALVLNNFVEVSIESFMTFYRIIKVALAIFAQKSSQTKK